MLNVLFAMEETALQSFVNFKSDLDKARALATPEQINSVKSSIQELQLSTGQSFFIDEESGDAIIPVSGTLTPKPEICVSLHDGSQTLYPTIVDSIAKANSISSVKRIKMIFSTPGGYVDGVESAAIAISNSEKEIIAEVGGMAASAGYWLASQANKIVASTQLSSVGSIGVLVEVVDRTKEDNDYGIKRYVLTSQNAPEKYPEIGTTEGRNKIISRLNDIEKVFLSRVASGRGKSVDEVIENFGQGSVLIAEDALRVGMIDSIENKASIVPQSEKLNAEIQESPIASIVTQSDSDHQENNSPAALENIKKQKEGSTMPTLKELLAENPGAQEEFNKALAEATASGEKKISARLDVSKNYLANENYPKAIHETAMRVAVGEQDPAVLMASVAAVDAVKQQQVAETATDETEAEGETPAQTPNAEQNAELSFQAKKQRLQG